MAQFARPDADLSTGNWSPNSGSSLYAVINETSPADVDYISVTDNYFGTAESCSVDLSSVTDPDSTTAHTVLVRAYTDSYSGSVTLSVALGTSSRTIRTASFTPTTNFLNYSMTLSTSEASSLSAADYADLRIQITAADSMGMGSETRVSWVYFTCPTAPVSVTPPAAACELTATFSNKLSQTITPAVASITTAASVSTVRLGVLKTIGTTTTVGTATPNSSSGSSPYTVGFSSAVTGAAVGDKVYFEDFSMGYGETYLYTVAAVNSTTSFDLTFVSGGASGNVTPYGNLYAADFSQAEGVFKRSFDYATPRDWSADLDDASIYSDGDDAIGAIAVNEKFDQTLGLDCNGDNVTLNSIKFTVLSDVRHNGTAGSGAGLRWTSSSSAGGHTAASQYIYIASPNITIEWMEFDGTGAAASSLQLYFLSGWDDVGNIHIRNNLLYGLDQKGGGIVCRAIRLETPSGTVIGTSSILNNIVYDIHPSTPSGGDVVGIYAIGGRAENSIYLYNNTVHHIVGTGTASGLSGFGRGIQSSSHTYVSNNIVSDVTAPVNADDFYGNEHADSDYNLSTDSTAPGSNSVTSATLADIYESATGTVNLHLKSGSPAIDAGTDLGRTPTGVNIDIDGRNRDAEGDTWSIGADQYFVNGIEVAPSSAAFVAAGINPTVSAGYPSVSVTPAVAAVVASAVSPTVSESSLAVTPSTASIEVAAVDPTVSVGYPSISVTPSVATIVVVGTFAGAGFTSVTVTPSVASFVADAVNPTASKDSFAYTPAVASFVAAGITPTVSIGSIATTPSVASFVAAAVSPATTLGSIAYTPTASSLVATSITPTLVFGSSTATPGAAEIELAASLAGIRFSSISVTPSVATFVAAAITPTVQLGSLSLGATASFEAAAQSPTSTYSSVTVPPADAAVLVESRFSGIVAGGVIVIPDLRATAVTAANTPTVAYGSQTVTPIVSSFVADATLAAVVEGSLTLSPTASIVEISAVSPTIDMGLDITPPVAAAVYDVASFTLLVGKLSAYVGYTFSGLVDYEIDGLIDYEQIEPIDYETTTSPIDYSTDGLLDYEYDN